MEWNCSILNTTVANKFFSCSAKIFLLHHHIHSYSKTLFNVAVTLPENGNLLPQNATFCSGPYEGYKSHVLEIPKYCKDASDKSDECNKQRLNIERDCVLAIDC
ncbi:hypothetical protein BCR32DRAFT_284693 [Anaeromyces robustus]|uniref:Uncharacterized protein n=1 Tax=Anaeromyces robustus TaxID=1754192 RepID=A0A1Y1WR20_9FUNG|nr:hypothetical protein BCR32DRAFT_284693 [Anaeromyces robustus]|eukprot:ORX75979.1 hypothetical protein BCR32DRAFT_284693 [Anaeromyces robustus]